VTEADRSPPRARGRTGLRNTVVVAVGSTVANLLGYVFNAVMSRALDLAAFGELGSLLAVMVVASVPGTALQAVIARRLTTGDDHHAFRRDTLLLAGSVGAAVVVLSPLIRTFLNVDSYAPVLWTAALLVPTTVGFGYLGMLQGAGRFRALGAMLVAVQAARVSGGIVAYATGRGTSTALGVAAVVTVVLVVVVAPFVGHRAVPARARRSELLRDIAADISPILGVLVLSNLDLLLARHFLSAHDSGLYVAGNLLTRGAFWGPAFVVLVTYPRLAVPAHRAAALRQGVIMLSVIGAAGLAVSVAAGGLIPVLLGRDDFRAVAGIAWLYTADGLTLVGTQFAVFAGLAVRDRRLGRLVWLAAAIETAVVIAFAHGSIEQVITVAVLTGLGLVIAATVVERRRPIPVLDPPTDERRDGPVP
jgi:O-antigen/teichoic acid export membrane protein